MSTVLSAAYDAPPYAVARLVVQQYRQIVLAFVRNVIPPAFIDQVDFEQRVGVIDQPAGQYSASADTGVKPNPPAEVRETEYPSEVNQYGFITETGGAGRTRGGLSLVREYRYLADAGNLKIRADRVRFAPYGLFGGKPGGKSKNQLSTADKKVTLAAKVKNVPLVKGDVVRHEMAGAGGYGWSFERDPE